MKKHLSSSKKITALVLVGALTTLSCVPALAAAPTKNNVSATATKISYVSSNMKTYMTVKFTNNSSKTVKSAKVKLTAECDETISATRTVQLNLKAGKSKTIKVYMQKCVEKPDNYKATIKSVSTTESVNAKLVKQNYDNSNGKTYTTVKFKNNFSKKVKSVRMKISGICNEPVSATKTVTLKLDAGKTKTVKIFWGQYATKLTNCKIAVDQIFF